MISREEVRGGMSTRTTSCIALVVFLCTTLAAAQSSGNFSYGTSPQNQTGCVLQSNGNITGGEQCQMNCSIDSSGNSTCTPAGGTCMDHAVAGIKTSAGSGNIFDIRPSAVIGLLTDVTVSSKQSGSSTGAVSSSALAGVDFQVTVEGPGGAVKVIPSNWITYDSRYIQISTNLFQVLANQCLALNGGCFITFDESTVSGKIARTRRLVAQLPHADLVKGVCVVVLRAQAAVVVDVRATRIADCVANGLPVKVRAARKRDTGIRGIDDSIRAGASAEADITCPSIVDHEIARDEGGVGKASGQIEHVVLTHACQVDNHRPIDNERGAAGQREAVEGVNRGVSGGTTRQRDHRIPGDVDVAVGARGQRLRFIYRLVRSRGQRVRHRWCGKALHRDLRSRSVVRPVGAADAVSLVTISNAADRRTGSSLDRGTVSINGHVPIGTNVAPAVAGITGRVGNRILGRRVEAVGFRSPCKLQGCASRTRRKDPERKRREWRL